MKERGQDYDKCVGFGSDGASTMIGKQNGVAVRFKEKINPFLTFVYCVKHMTNLKAIDAIKVRPYKDMSKEIDVFLNSIAVHFKKLYKKKKMYCSIAGRACKFYKVFKKIL